MRIAAAIAAVLLPIAACQHPPTAGPPDAAPADAGLPPLAYKVDMLFVVDNSACMSSEQVSLAAAFPRLIERLTARHGKLPSLHIGITASDLGADPYTIPSCEPPHLGGTLQTTARRAGCTPPAGAFIVAAPEGNNFSGRVEDAFSCIAQLGTDGCGFEQHLESMKRALDGTHVQAAEFLREDALLVVVIVADEDDCSAKRPDLFDPASPIHGPLTSFRCFDQGVVCAEPTSRTPGVRTRCRSNEASVYVEPITKYYDFLTGLKGSPDRVVIGGIIGNADPVMVGTDNQNNATLLPSCSSIQGEAAPAVRLTELTRRFGLNGLVSTICQPSYDESLGRIADRISVVLPAPDCPEFADAGRDATATD